MVLAKDISEKLEAHYPGHLWAIHVNSEQGVVVIKNYSISYIYGYLLHLKAVQQDPGRKLCIMGAGEVLERAKMRRGSWRVGEKAVRIDGVREKHQPRFDGRIIL